MRILHVGCGRKKLGAAALAESVGLTLAPDDTFGGPRVIHLDADPRLSPDLVCRLGSDRIDLPDSSVDIIIAWHVLEHIGRQGEAHEWFRAFEEMYRVLAPGGLLYGECPYYTGVWAWSDPTHTRAISERSFVFFNQEAYLRPGSPISPYRIACDFQFAGMPPALPRGWAVMTTEGDAQDTALRFALVARKPFVPWWED